MTPAEPGQVWTRSKEHARVVSQEISDLFAKCIRDSEDGEPWSARSSLPAESQVAVHVGLVKPIDCPDCIGLGVVSP